MGNDLKTTVRTTRLPANGSLNIIDCVTIIYGLTRFARSSPQQAANSNNSCNGISRQMAVYRLMKKTEALKSIEHNSSL